jgi:hypothetical protein
MFFGGKWMGLAIITKSVSQRQVLYISSHMWNLGGKGTQKLKGSVRNVEGEKE